LLDILYSQLARSRRRYYERRPHLRRRLAAPVISIGNLTVGGSGKTPLAGEIARMLLDLGERPSILSRGYARQRPSDGVVIVSDGRETKTDVAHAGDEPFMLAHAVPGACVLVSASRYLAGRLAETQLGCTVHILDDGFQHFPLMRDIDLLLTPETLDDAHTLPFGRFREPIDAARAADALLVPVTDGPDVAAMSDRLKVKPAFAFTRSLGEPRVIADGRSHRLRQGSGESAEALRAEAERTGPAYVGPILSDGPAQRLDGPPMRAFAFAGIARPERFYGDLERSGWQLTGSRSFPDHHPYMSEEIEQISRTARDTGADVILTTEKDAVRLPKKVPGTFLELPVASVPLYVSVEPAFHLWLGDRLRVLRGDRS
jgi:tetraacyldisaccharide 4'-kinase